MTTTYLRETRVRDRIERRGRFATGPPEQFERTLTCTACGTPERVFEAAMGARTPAEHEYNAVASFRCIDCLVGKT